jgi:hypothetical protein
MPRLFLLDSKELIGEIPQEQLDFLLDSLVEEDSQDRDYFVDQNTIEMLEEDLEDVEDKAPGQAVIALLKEALGEKEGIDIYWS